MASQEILPLHSMDVVYECGDENEKSVDESESENVNGNRLYLCLFLW